MTKKELLEMVAERGLDLEVSDVFQSDSDDDVLARRVILSSARSAMGLRGPRTRVAKFRECGVPFYAFKTMFRDIVTTLDGKVVVAGWGGILD